MPKIGPIANRVNMYIELVESIRLLRNWILRMVIANPIEFKMVSAVPLSSIGAFLASRVENNGESAMTTMPHNKRKSRNT